MCDIQIDKIYLHLSNCSFTWVNTKVRHSRTVQWLLSKGKLYKEYDRHQGNIDGQESKILPRQCK